MALGRQWCRNRRQRWWSFRVFGAHSILSLQHQYPNQTLNRKMLNLTGPHFSAHFALKIRWVIHTCVNPNHSLCQIHSRWGQSAHKGEGSNLHPRHTPPDYPELQLRIGTLITKDERKTFLFLWWKAAITARTQLASGRFSDACQANNDSLIQINPSSLEIIVILDCSCLMRTIFIFMQDFTFLMCTIHRQWSIHSPTELS